ncbi:hypothetical protein ACCO45_001075 [Purpureocillium lilacinum]|uniref:Uncharacterized protein n=1 Tax=Purpureocillium lilacinum TaxID=33203 RepID=A0ACC4E6J2_PURLI
MTNEAGGLSLPSRFMAYNQYLGCLRDLLVRCGVLPTIDVAHMLTFDHRSPNFDLNLLEKLRRQILRLRDARGIPLPRCKLVPSYAMMLYPPSTSIRLYTGPKTYSRSHCLLEPLLGGSKCTGRNVARVPTFIDSFGRSKSLGPHRPWGHLDVPPNSKILFRRLESCFMYLTLCPSDGISSFDDDQISLTVYRNSRDASPYLLLRIFDQGTPWFALRGVHELCIERNGSCLQFKRWSRSEKRSKTWAVLCFMTWEELVLMHSTFVSLKARNRLTVQLGPEEYTLKEEQKHFQARILDDGFKHSLIVYEDRATKALRLHAAVWDGELRQCPVWTAFVTHQSSSPTWLKRISRHRVRLADIQLYVFCRQYRQQNQRRGRIGAFEINFISDEAARRFEEFFYPPAAGPAVMAANGV